MPNNLKKKFSIHLKGLKCFQSITNSCFKIVQKLEYSISTFVLTESMPDLDSYVMLCISYTHIVKYIK